MLQYFTLLGISLNVSAAAGNSTAVDVFIRPGDKNTLFTNRMLSAYDGGLLGVCKGSAGEANREVLGLLS